MRKFIGLLAVALVAVFAFASVASASSNLPNGSTISATSTGNIVMNGGLVTCTSSTLHGTLTNLAAGATVLTDSATFSGCSTTVVPCNGGAGWDIATTGGGPSVWTGNASNICVDITISGKVCHYTGTLTGSYTNPSGTTPGLLQITGGSLSSTSGFPCPSTGTFTGKWDVAQNLVLS